MYKVSFVVPRDSEDETTVAVVTTVVKDKHNMAINEFLSTLQFSITGWVTCTEEGKKAYLASGKDFNVGDLAALDIEASGLLEFLTPQGIYSLEVQIFADDSWDRHWSFDTKLVKE
jgi:hypothetical protein